MDDNTIVIDNGSAIIKAGIAGCDEPVTVFPTIIGYSRFKSGSHFRKLQNEFIGNDTNRGGLELNYPNENATVDWAEMEKIWRYTFEQLSQFADPSQSPVLLIDNGLFRENRPQTTEIMFETFNVPLFYTSMQSLAALYSAGKLTGLVLDSGHAVTQAVPINESYPLTNSIQRMHIAGRQLTQYLIDNVTIYERYLKNSPKREIMRDIKEKLCYVAFDENGHSLEMEYELPDGQKIAIKNHLSWCTEALFATNAYSQGIDQLINSTIQSCDVDIKAELYTNIVLHGGSTMFPGFVERLQKELCAIVPAGTEVNIIDPPEKKYSAWIGGSIIASLSTFQTKCITKEEYDEVGSAVVHRKCF